MGTAQVVRILEMTNHAVTISGYGDERTETLSGVVNAATKVVIPGFHTPFIFLINNMTLNTDPNIVRCCHSGNRYVLFC